MIFSTITRYHKSFPSNKKSWECLYLQIVRTIHKITLEMCKMENKSWRLFETLQRMHRLFFLQKLFQLQFPHCISKSFETIKPVSNWEQAFSCAHIQFGYAKRLAFSIFHKMQYNDSDFGKPRTRKKFPSSLSGFSCTHISSIIPPENFMFIK